ncbi:MAG: iron ABC transporter permease [Euryarchaeota archaeon]|nr:iron ABC transporter permease [Euryarchaeota archaeon]
MTDDGDERDILKKEYRHHIVWKMSFIALIVAAIFAAAGVTLTLGGRDIGFVEVYRILFDHLGGVAHVTGTPAWWDDHVVWNVRLPRILVAIVAGAGLAVGGAAMQAVVRNPLADPYTTGISSGAVFGVAVALTLGFGAGTRIGSYGLMVNAFIFGLVPMTVIVLMSRFTKTSPATMILAGIAMTYMFSALSTLLLVTSGTETIHRAYLWQIGSLENATWSDVPLMFAVTLIGSIFLMLSTKKLNLLTLGDESAKSLGLDAENFRVLILVVLSVMTAAIIGSLGVIGFVGLVSPHIVRAAIGSDNRYLIPAAALFGALLMLAADLIARIVIHPGEIPVGLVMSFIGGPLFLLLILRSKKGVW